VPIERVLFEVDDGLEPFAGAILRYDLLERLRRTAEKHDVAALAFGLGASEVRLVLEGDATSVGEVLKGLKGGTARVAAGWGYDLGWKRPLRFGVTDLDAAVAWAHRAPVDAGAQGPLASPWSSHRDLLRYRDADFYDAAALRGRVDVARVHAEAGGGALPDGWPPAKPDREPLAVLLRVSAAVLGVLPADRRCFRVFVHLARLRGWGTAQVAETLAVTPRRVRQLLTEPEPRVRLAVRTLGDPVLMRIP
jgi:hypothetical protein